MCECIMNLLTKICESICSLGWDEIGTIATVAAVVVALFANRNANKQLKAALKIQEQSKNVDLFDKRVAIMTEIKEKNMTAELQLQLLFDKTIVDAYAELCVSISAQQVAEHDMKVYENLLRHPDGEGGYTSLIAQLQDTERLLDEHNYPEDRVKEYDELCEKHKCFYTETGSPEDAKWYNYKDLSNGIGRTMKAVEANKNVVLNLMQEYIKQSISPVDKKRR